MKKFGMFKETQVICNVVMEQYLKKVKTVQSFVCALIQLFQPKITILLMEVIGTLSRVMNNSKNLNNLSKKSKIKKFLLLK